MAFPPGTKLLEADRTTIIPKKIVMAQMRKLAKALREQPALAFTSSKPCQTLCNFMDASMSPTSSSPKPENDNTKKPHRPPLSHIIRAVNAAASTTSDLPAPPETETTTPLPTLLAEPLLKDIKPVKPAAITLQPDEVLDHNGRPRKKMPHEMPFSPVRSENERPKLKAVKRKAPPPSEAENRKAGLKGPDANRWGDFKIPRKQ